MLFYLRNVFMSSVLAYRVLKNDELQNFWLFSKNAYY